MEISIIILTYNSSKFIDSLLSGLISKYKKELKEQKLEIIIADNDSKDDTVKLAKTFKEIRVVENGGNVGFAAGNNLAVKHAKGKLLIFMNPDVIVASGDVFDLIPEFEDEKMGIVGGKIENYAGKRELSCGKVYNAFNIFLLSVGLEETMGVRFAPNKKEEVDFVSGAFLMIKKSLYETLLGFDEHYFMYIEDADLCFRAKKAGYKVLFSPLATIQHMGQGSSNRTFAVINIYKGLLYFQKNHMSALSYSLVKLLLKTKATVLIVMGKLVGNSYLIKTYEEAIKAT